MALRYPAPLSTLSLRLPRRGWPICSGRVADFVRNMQQGLKPEEIIWYQERGEHFSHTGATAEAGLKLPPAINLHYAKTDLITMLINHELDASAPIALGASADSGIDRSRAELSSNNDIVTLFTAPRQEAIRFYKKTGIYPPHHATVVRESILNEHPWVAISLMEAFEESKKLAIERLRNLPPTLMVFGEHYLKDTDDIFGLDPYQYGIKANAKVVDMAQMFSMQQGLTNSKQSLEEIFPQEVIYREERIS